MIGEVYFIKVSDLNFIKVSDFNFIVRNVLYRIASYCNIVSSKALPTN